MRTRKTSRPVSIKEMKEANKRLNAKYGWKNPWKKGIDFRKPLT